MAGFYGLNYRTAVGLHLSSRSDSVPDASGPLWDCYVGGLPFLLWVQAKRDRPDADLAEFQGVGHGDLQWAHLGGLLEKQKRAATGNAKQSRKRPSSRSSSPGR